jgi:hypothetical protein
MICQLCKCPYCGSIVGLDRYEHAVVFQADGPCSHLVYVAWSLTQWQVGSYGSQEVAWDANGDWRSLKVIAAVDEHPSTFLEDELADLSMAGIDEQLAGVAPHQVAHGQRTIERLLTAEEKAQHTRGKYHDWVIDFEAKQQCVFAANAERFINYLASRSPFEFQAKTYA